MNFDSKASCDSQGCITLDQRLNNAEDIVYIKYRSEPHHSMRQNSLIEIWSCQYKGCNFYDTTTLAAMHLEVIKAINFLQA